MTETDQVSGPRPDPENDEQDEITDELIPDVPVETPPMSGTPLLRRNEQDPYGLEQEGEDVVQSDLVGAAELSSEYTTDQASQQTDAPATETQEAWREARDDWDEARRESGDPRGPR